MRIPSRRPTNDHRSWGGCGNGDGYVDGDGYGYGDGCLQGCSEHRFRSLHLLASRTFLALILAVLSAIFPVGPLAARQAIAKAPNDQLGRLSRVGEGYKNLRDEFVRLEERIVDTRKKIAQSELNIANGSQAMTVLNNQAQQIQNSLSPPGGGGTRPGQPGPGGNARNNQLQNQLIALNNQLLQVTAQVRQERLRATELGADLNRSLQQQLKLRQQGYKQQDEYWSVGDQFGRLSKEELESVVAELDRQLQDDPDNPGALCVRGIAMRRLGKVNEAESDLTRVVKMEEPIQVVALAARGELYYALGKEKEGKADLAKATTLTKKKSDPRLLLYRGWILCGQQRFDQAEIELTKALRLGSVDSEAHRLLALIGVYFDGAGQPPVSAKETLEHATRAKQLTKGADWLTLEALAAAQFVAGDEAAAIETAKKAVELTDGEIKARCEERLSFYESGRRPLASWPDVFRLELPQ